MKFNICNSTSGVDLGDFEGASKCEALDAMARDAGAKSYRDLCSITDPEDLDAEVERCVAGLIVTQISE